MGQIRDLMIDFCELSVQRIDGWERQECEFESVMHRLTNVHRVEHADFLKFVTATRIVAKIGKASGERKLRWATKLWNAIDCLRNPDAFWLLMLRELPDVFYDDNANCMKFTY